MEVTPACADEAAQPQWKALRRKVSRALAAASAECAAPAQTEPKVAEEAPYQQDVKLAAALASRKGAVCAQQASPQQAEGENKADFAICWKAH